MTLFLTQFPVWSLQRTGRREQKGLRLQSENIVQLLHYFKEAVSPDFLDFFLHKSNPPGPLTMQAKNVQLKDQFSHSYYFLISQLTKKLTKHVGQQAENCSHLFKKKGQIPFQDTRNKIYSDKTSRLSVGSHVQYFTNISAKTPLSAKPVKPVIKGSVWFDS